MSSFSIDVEVVNPSPIVLPPRLGGWESETQKSSPPASTSSIAPPSSSSSGSGQCPPHAGRVASLSAFGGLIRGPFARRFAEPADLAADRFGRPLPIEAILACDGQWRVTPHTRINIVGGK